MKTGTPSLEMTVAQVHRFLDLFQELGITVWIDGGWGVDALLGEQTRQHQDLDIILAWANADTLTAALRTRGFVDVHTDDRTDRNFVMGHHQHGQIDFHIVDLLENGGATYGPDWTITEAELNSVGTIGGRTVRCLSPTYQVRSHAGYTLQQTDYHDLQQLQRKFRLPLLPEQREGDR